MKLIHEGVRCVALGLQEGVGLFVLAHTAVHWSPVHQGVELRRVATAGGAMSAIGPRTTALVVS